MSKAEDKAEKAYPYPAWSNETTRAIDDLRRNAFIEGYRQAEKDLELSWEDIDWIVGEAVCRVSEDSEAEQICKEVLKLFKERKENLT